MKALRTVLLLAASLLAAMFVYVVAARIAFPYELEWMCGSVLDHVERVRAGLPIYTAPTTRWIPFFYPPLFYWVAAPLGGGFVACRLLSLAATAVQAGCIGWIARRSGATGYWSVLAVLVFFGAFFYVGYWYDVERSDTLCGALVLAATVVLLRWEKAAAALAAGVLLGLAFFAKQQALPFAAAATAALLLRREWTRAAALVAGAALVLGGITGWQNAATGGWFSYYVFRMPAAHGVDPRLWRDVWDYDVRKGWVLIAVTIGVLVMLLRDAWRGDRAHLVFALMLAAGGVSALSSRLHVGGWINSLEFWTSFACPALAVAGSRADAWLVERRQLKVGAPVVYGLVLVQLALWVHSPRERVPDATLRGDTERLEETIGRLERGGEVLVVGRGHVTTPTHFQMSALADVARMSGAPPDLVDAVRTRRLAAIVDDARLPGGPELGLWPPVMLEDIPALRPALLANYYVAERIDDAAGRVAMPAPALPRWVYRPREHPLAEGGVDVERRHDNELGLAERRSAAVLAGQPPPFPAEQIEELAAGVSSASR